MINISFLYGFLLCAIIALCVSIWIIALKYVKKEVKPVRNHVDLYFDEHFRNIIKEWDILGRGEVKNWTQQISKRLDTVGDYIGKLKESRKHLDQRMSKLEEAIASLEVI